MKAIKQAYYLPNKDRPNFRVLPDAVAHRIIMKDCVNAGDVSAEGVEFEHDGKVYTVRANKEVIVCAG